MSHDQIIIVDIKFENDKYFITDLSFSLEPSSPGTSPGTSPPRTSSPKTSPRTPSPGTSPRTSSPGTSTSGAISDSAANFMALYDFDENDIQKNNKIFKNLSKNTLTNTSISEADKGNPVNHLKFRFHDSNLTLDCSYII